MIKTVFVVLVTIGVALPAFGKTYKSTYTIPCSKLWGAVKDTLSNGENYTVVENDDAPK